MSKTFGLDIGSTSIKVVSLKKDEKNISLNTVVSSPSTPKGLLSESVLDQQLLADTIKQLLSSAKIQETSVNIAVPESQVFTKIIEMPYLSEQELSAALKWEMEQYIPLPLDQVRTDYQVLSTREQEGKKTMNVLLVAAPALLLEKYEKILKFSGLTAVSVETEMISVFRSLQALFVDGSPSLLAHIGSTTTNVAFISQGVLQSVFSIPVGGIAITRAISVDLGIDINQAENFKKAYGLNQEAFQGKIGKSLYPVLENLIVDVKKTLLQQKEKNQNQDVKQLVLSGGSALLPGIDVYFTNTLGVQVVVGSAWSVNSIANVPEQVLSESPGYNTVVGLALKDNT